MHKLVFNLYVPLIFLSIILPVFVHAQRGMTGPEILRYYEYLEADNKIECTPEQTALPATSSVFKIANKTVSCVTPTERDRIMQTIGIDINTARLDTTTRSSNNLLNIANENSGFSNSNGSSDSTNFFEKVVPSSTFGGTPLSNLLNQIFYMGLAVAVILAIVMIVRGGIQYMTIDAYASKDSGKKMVQAALGGLVLAFAAILILNTINKNITSFTLSFDPLQGVIGLATSTLTLGTRTSPTTGQSNGAGANSVVKGDFSNVTANDLRSQLGSNYSDADVQAFIDAGKQYNIDPRFLASVSKFETGNGTSKAFTDGRNNAMGISNANGPVGFSSVRDSIFTQANNLTKEGGYYTKASTIQEIGDIYSPAINPETGKPYQNDPNGTNWSWAENVSSNYNQMTSGRTGN